MNSEVKRKIEFDGVRNALLNTIPDGMTNGDVIKALFPNFYYTEGRTKAYYSDYPNISMQSKTEWWNAPYKENKE